MQDPEHHQIESIQRLLGRCLLRLQHYEKLLKHLWADHEVSGAPGQLMEVRAQRLASLGKSPLGDVRNKLLASFFRPATEEEGDEAHHQADGRSPDEVHFSLATHHLMPPEAHEQFVQDTHELVQLRNDLVHHLLDRHDLSSPEGRTSCLAYLKSSLNVIGARHQELLSVCKTHIEAREHLAAFAQSDAFRTLLVHGILPDGSFEWASAGIVGSLHEAASALARTDGWTPLDLAVQRIAVRNPEHVPAAYGCASWPQVLSTSRLFELRYEAIEGGKKRGVFRRIEAR